ncbi:hypothetical protein MYX82_08760 [Acidobacteria bacterium AH-259-D05]|nr:hypothetical protein [Acidobacteria bacterium AH-259-D05]
MKIALSSLIPLTALCFHLYPFRSLEGAELESMELSFSRATARAGEKVALPIYLKSDDNIRESFQLTLRFSPGQLLYEGLESGYLARKAGWVLTAELKKAPDEESPRELNITVQPGGADFFPSGLIAQAYFVIMNGVPDGHIVVHGSLERLSGANQTIQEVPTHITVYSEAIYGCLFYMH